MKKMTNEVWLNKLKERNSCKCPNHKGKISDSIVKGTFWCSDCKKFWRVSRNNYSWKAIWYYVSKTAKTYIEE